MSGVVRTDEGAGMLKFFRKYNKVILVVGGSILMVIFLLPAGLSQVLNSQLTRPAGKLDGKTVSVREVQQAAMEVQVLKGMLDRVFLVFGLDQTNAGEHWMLLTEAARRAGLVGGVNDGADFLERVAQLNVDLFAGSASLNDRDKLLQTVLANIQSQRQQAIQRYGMSVDQVDKALAKARGVLRMILAADPSTVYSKPEAIELGKEINDTATVAMTLIPAETLLPGVSVPSDEELQAHFEKYKDVRPDDDPYGIGYLQPPAVSIEWINIDHDALSTAITLDPIEVNKYWRSNRTRFPGEFVAERGSVEAAYRLERVGVVLKRLDELLQREIYKTVSKLPGTSQTKQLPPDWQSRMPKLESLSAMLRTALTKEFGISQVESIVSIDSSPG